jgi:hypothetical protein
MSQSSVVGIVTRLQAGRSGVRIPVGTRSFSSPERQNQIWRPPSLLFSEHWGSLSVGNWPGCVVNHSPPSSDKIKNVWKCARCTHAPPPVCLQGVDKETFTALSRGNICPMILLGLEDLSSKEAKNIILILVHITSFISVSLL